MRIYSIIFCLLLISATSLFAEQEPGKNVQIINVSKNTTNVQTGGSKINSGIDFGDSKPVANLIKGSNKPATRTIKTPAFTGITASRGMKITVNISSSKPTIQVSGDDNIIPLLKVKVNKNNLSLNYEKSFSTQRELKITINTPSLKKLSASSGAKIIINNLKTDNFELTGNQAANIIATGNVSMLKLKLSSASSFDGAKLTVVDAQVILNSAARAKLNVIGKVTGNNNFGTCSFVNKPKENLIKSNSRFNIRKYQ